MTPNPFPSWISRRILSSLGPRLGSGKFSLVIRSPSRPSAMKLSQSSLLNHLQVCLPLNEHKAVSASITSSLLNMWMNWLSSENWRPVHANGESTDGGNPAGKPTPPVPGTGNVSVKAGPIAGCALQEAITTPLGQRDCENDDTRRRLHTTQANRRDVRKRAQM